MGRNLLIWYEVGLRFSAEHVEDGVKQNWWYLFGRLGHICSCTDDRMAGINTPLCHYPLPGGLLMQQKR